MSHYEVDLEVAVLWESWLIADDDTFPTAVEAVYQTPEGTWAFSGEEYAVAHWLGPSSRVTLKSVKVSTYKDGPIPVILGSVTIDGMSPRKWVRQGGDEWSRDTDGGARVPARFHSVCATWFDVRAPVEGENERSNPAADW